MKQRSIVELLELMLQNTKLFKHGLCSWACMLFYLEKISDDEKYTLLEYIEHNRVSRFSSMDAFLYRKSAWFWRSGDIAPRIKWINKHINKLKKCR